MFANIVVDVKSANVDLMYTYKIPNELEEIVDIGSRVLVSFGVRKVIGYVIEKIEESKYEGEVKEILEVLDYSQQLTEEQIFLAKYISKETKSLLVYCLETMYPSFLKTKYNKYIFANNIDNVDAEIALLFDGKKKIAVTSETIKRYPKILKEIKNGNIEFTYDIYQYGKRKKEKFYYVNDAYRHLFDTLTLRRIECLRYIDKNPKCTANDIKEAIGCSIFLIQALVKEGYLLFEEDYIVLEDVECEKIVNKPFIFNFEQKQLIDKFTVLSGKPFLLYSNDEAFKYDFYLNEAVKTVKAGKKVFIVTPTLLDNFKIRKYFNSYLSGYKILSFGNDLSNNDYYLQHLQVIKGNYDIIITSKVGAFLPVNNLGLVIGINEGNFNYLNEYTPKYNLIKVLEQRSKYFNAKFVMTTSCPQIDTYHQYAMAKCYLLKYVVNNDSNLMLVDLNDEIGQINSIISRHLQLEISKCLNNRQQVILMLNSKGYSNYMICRNCSKILKCPKCEIPLTYYKEKDEFKCRYCGRKSSEVTCECGCKTFNKLKNGLENLKEKVQELFPSSKILQIDSDTIKTTADYHEALLSIENQDVDIIIGTRGVLSIFSSQIRLIGVINIDEFLNGHDYRSSENTFSLICECMDHLECKTVIQGYHLDNPNIISAINRKYDYFYDTEIENRRQYFYPPYCEINRLIITGDYKDMYYCANYLKKIVGTILKDTADALGPLYLSKYKGVQIIIKHNNFEKISQIIDEVSKKFVDKRINIQFERYPRNFG